MAGAPRSYTLANLARLLSLQLEGDGSVTVDRLEPLAEASPGSLSFLAFSRQRRHLPATRASAVLLKPEWATQCPTHALLAEDPYLAYARASHLFAAPPPFPPGKHPQAQVHPSVQVPESASIGPFCSLEEGVVLGERVCLGAAVQLGAGCVLGDDCVLYSNVVLYHGVRLGRKVRIHAGAVLGADGFGFAPSPGGWEKIAQLGGVVVGDDAEIGANTTIDRGSLQDTCIGQGVIIDNQVQIGHNVRIGDHSAIAGCVGIAGSTRIGAHCAIGGAVGIAGHLDICDRVQVTAMSFVGRSISEAGSYSSGTLAQPTPSWRRNALQFMRLAQALRGRKH